jgi:hypothetical protein
VTRARDKANLTQKVTTSEPTQLTNGMIWLDTDAVAVSQQSMRWTKTPSGGTTVLSGASDSSITLSYSVGQEQVYANGVLLIRGSDYTASDGTSITLASASVAGDVFEVISIIPLTLVDTYTQTQANDAFVKTVGGSTIISATASTKPLVLKGAASQSANLLEIQNNSGTVFASVNSSGLVALTANTAALPAAPTGTALRTVGADATTSIILMDGAGGGSAGQFIGRRSQGTIAAPTSTTSGVFLSVFGGRGYGATGHIATNSADIIMHSAEAFTDTASGGYITLNTTPTGTVGTPTERVRIDASGNVGIGTGTPTAKLDVNGSIKSDNLSGRNAVINGGFDIAQRGTSFTALAGAAYTLDRWVPWSTTGGQSNYASRESAGNLSVTPNQAIQYCMRVGRTAGTTNTGGRQLFHTIETANSVRFAGKTVAFSFYARKGADYSNTDSILNFYVGSGTGTDQIYYSFTGSAAVIAQTSVTLTTSWQRFTATGTVATNATELAMSFLWSPTGTAGAADYLEITGVQLEEGSVATPFSRAGGTIQGELAACQRYYWRSTANAYNNQVYGGGFAASTTAVLAPFSLPSQMRTVPTVIGYANIYVTDEVTNFTPSNLVANSRTSVNILQIQPTVSGATTYRPYLVVGNGTAGSFIDASAEL